MGRKAVPQPPRCHHLVRKSGRAVPGRSNLPQEASGAYALSPNPAEVIEIILNGDGDSVRLQGYLTRMGDGQSDQGAPLSFFFARTTVGPTQLSFITRQVHGIWWSFAGTIERGKMENDRRSKVRRALWQESPPPKHTGKVGPLNRLRRAPGISIPRAVHVYERQLRSLDQKRRRDK